MAVQTIRMCDLCHSQDGVNVMTVAYGKEVFEVDLCNTCWEERSKVYENYKRRPTRSTLKPQHRFKKTSITKTAL